MADEDDRWLYGDCNQEDEPEKDASAAFTAGPEVTKNVDLQPPEIRTEEEKCDNAKEEAKEDLPHEEEEDEEEEEEEEEEETQNSSENKEKKENGELDDEKCEDEEEDEDDDDSDEDNVNVIIGDINKSGPTYTNINIPKRGPNISGPGVKSAGKFSMEDFEAIGVINGVAAHEFNVDGIEDKPWRMPGADITDYFNYGFNEETWKAYCERQKRIRIHESCTGLPTQTLANQSWAGAQGSQNSQYPNAQSGGKKVGWEIGQIRVIGAGVASRRIDESGPDNQNIQVLPPNSNFSGIPPPNIMPQMIPPMEMPPSFSSSGDHYGGPPASNEYFNPEPDYFSSYEPTAADQWRDNWTPGNLVTFGQSVKPVHSHLDDSNSQDRKDRDKDRERDRSLDRDRDRNLDRDDKDKRKDRSHRNRSRSKSHERKRKSRSRSRSRSRSPSHKKHKKKSKKSDKKKRSDDE